MPLRLQKCAVKAAVISERMRTSQAIRSLRKERDAKKAARRLLTKDVWRTICACLLTESSFGST
jgi:hypothetical protein